MDEWMSVRTYVCMSRYTDTSRCGEECLAKCNVCVYLYLVVLRHISHHHGCMHTSVGMQTHNQARTIISIKLNSEVCSPKLGERGKIQPAYSDMYISGIQSAQVGRK
jgi:hypothetical protein